MLCFISPFLQSIHLAWKVYLQVVYCCAYTVLFPSHSRATRNIRRSGVWRYLDFFSIFDLEVPERHVKYVYDLNIQHVSIK